MMAIIGTIATQQANPTTKTMEAITQLLNYKKQKILKSTRP